MKNKQSSIFLNKNLAIKALVVLLIFCGNSFAQKDPVSELDAPASKTPKTSKKAPTPKATPKVAPPVVKKPETPRVAKRVVVKKRVVSPPVSAKKETLAKETTGNVQTTGRFVRVTFKAPEKGLEIEIDKKGGFYIKNNGQLEVPLTPGRHNIIVRRNGVPITDLLQLTVSREQNVIDLTPYLKVEVDEDEEPPTPKVQIKPSEKPNNPKTETPPPTEETQGNNNFNNNSPPVNVASQMVSQNFVNILNRYKDPKQTDSVNMKDWMYIYQNTVIADSLPNFSRDYLTLLMSFSEGQIKLLQGKFSESINSFTAALTISKALKDALGGESPLNYYGIGNAFFADKQYDRAIWAYQEAIKLDPKLAMPYRRLGDVYVTVGKNREAIGYHAKADELGYGSYETSLTLANNLRLNSNCDDALKVYERLSKENPNDTVFIGMGDCYVQKKLSVRAIDYYRKAIEYNKKSAISYYKLGMIYFEIKDYQMSLEFLQKALDNDPDGKAINRWQTQKTIDNAKEKAR